MLIFRNLYQEKNKKREKSDYLLHKYFIYIEFSKIINFSKSEKVLFSFFLAKTNKIILFF